MTAYGLLTRLVLIAATVTPVSACLFRVWVHQEAVRLGYQLSMEEKKGHELAELEKQLEIELAAERSPSRLMQLAHDLGLRAPQPTQVIGQNAKSLMAQVAPAPSAKAVAKKTAKPAGGHGG